MMTWLTLLWRPPNASTWVPFMSAEPVRARRSINREEFNALVDHLCASAGKPATLLADAGYGGERIVAALEARKIEPLIAVSRQQTERPYDFRPPKEKDKPPRQITAPW
jgi:hypothetical protein